MTEFGKKYESVIKDYIANGNLQILSDAFNSFAEELLKNDLQMTYDIDDVLLLKIIELAIKDKYTKQRMQSDYLSVLKMINNDRIIDALMQQRPRFVGRVIDDTAPICYLDQNLFTPFIHGENIGYDISKTYVVPYSPAHIIEIGQTKNEDIIREEIKLVSDNTSNREILFCDNSFVIYNEHPQYCYQRVYDGTQDIDLAKEDKILNSIIEDVRFDGYRTDKLRNVYNSQNPDHFLQNHQELVDDILNKLGITYGLDYIHEVGNCNDYNIINELIHNLYRVMDICGFKKDNKECKVRSSRIDIEHLLYGSVGELFLTRDEKLRVRARNIYEVMGKHIECPDI